MRGGRLRGVLSRAREIGDVVVVVVVVAMESGRKGDILPSFAIPLLPVPTKDAFLQVSWKRKEILSSLARDVSKIEFFSTSRVWEKYFGNERWKLIDVTEDD